MSYGGRTEVLVWIPGSFFAALECRDGKRFCLLVGQFLVSSFGFRVSSLCELCVLCGSQTPSLTHSITPPLPSGHWQIRCKPNPPLKRSFVAIRDIAAALACHAAEINQHTVIRFPSIILDGNLTDSIPFRLRSS